ESRSQHDNIGEEYGKRGTIISVRNTEVVAVTSLASLFIMVQLRAPLTIQTYQPRSIATTIITKKLGYKSKVVPWDYQEEEKTKMINTATAHGMTRSGRYYVPNNLKRPTSGRTKNQKRNVTDVEIAEFERRCRSNITQSRNN
ncbi:hypothetical protein HAX54_008649, partial [Datura stramonium]|nr:hypothetical protein [Datura stramonium]